ncbi:hypothetical protein [Salinibacter grassmerensis]|uniref:hypothetical protein n=1 Tax=Salinibacter grassmerensis TaxID=3040353 RepID=UPI0021E76E0A|nr:hypothetical protein [Salinibacter grassmerensis]
MPKTQSKAKGSEQIVREICRGDLSEEENKRKVSALIKSHPERFRIGLRKLEYWGGDLWDRASENLGYGEPESLKLEATKYLLEVPQKGKHKGGRRICTFLEDDRPFGEWMSSKIFGFVRKIQSEIKEEKEKLEELEKPHEDPVSAKDKRKDVQDGRRPRVENHHADIGSLAGSVIGQLGEACRSALEAFFSDDSEAWRDVQEKNPDMESCLLRCGEIMRQEDVDLTRFVDHPGKARLWDCVQDLSGRYRSLILRRFFQGLDYWKLGRDLSDNEREDYESWEKYKRAEYDWARRFKDKCKDKVEQQCQEEAADYMNEAG